MLHGVRLVIPLLLLWVIIRRVDLTEVGAVLQATAIGYFYAGVLVGSFAQVFLGAWRWHYYMTRVYGLHVSGWWCLQHYWIGMFVGYFVPGGLGWDAYRVTSGNKQSPGLLVHATIVMLEKLAGLLACVLLVVVSFPFVSEFIVHERHARSLGRGVYLLMAITVAMMVAVIIFRKGAAVSVQGTENIIKRSIQKLMRSDQVVSEDVIVKGARALSRPREGMAIWGSSIALKVCMALGGWLFLRALHTEVPLSINLFVMPLTAIIFMLPISFGSLGVREGAFILLYGLFGVTPTVALGVSILGLAGLLITVGSGGLIMLASGMKAQTLRRAL